VVRIHSPRPILQKSSEICRVQSGSSLGFDAQIGLSEPSARYFKRWPYAELFNISSDAVTCGWFRPRTRRREPLCSPYADRQHPPSLPPRVHCWKAGAVLKDRSIWLYTKPLRSSARSPIGTSAARSAWWLEIRRGSDASGQGFMPRNDISAEDRERYARARARGDARVADPSSVVNARYVSGADAIELRLWAVARCPFGA